MREYQGPRATGATLICLKIVYVHPATYRYSFIGHFLFQQVMRNVYYICGVLIKRRQRQNRFLRMKSSNVSSRRCALLGFWEVRHLPVSVSLVYRVHSAGLEPNISGFISFVLQFSNIFPGKHAAPCTSNRSRTYFS